MGPGISNTIRRVLGGDEEPADAGEDEEDSHVTEFQKVNVSATDDYQLRFTGFHRYDDEEGGPYVVEREFDVYTDEDSLRDGRPRIDVIENHYVGEGDHRTLTDEREFEIVAEIDTDLTGTFRDNQVHEFTQRWHREHPVPR